MDLDICTSNLWVDMVETFALTFPVFVGQETEVAVLRDFEPSIRGLTIACMMFTR